VTSTHAAERDAARTAARGASSVLFVCLGNICRSPLAQGVFEHHARSQGLTDLVIASRGTGDWHVGDPPDPRTLAVAKRNGLTLTSRGALYTPRDHAAFDLVLAMDRANLAEVRRRGCPPERSHLFLACAAGQVDPALDLQVPDPYRGGERDFDDCYRLVHVGTAALLAAIATPGKC
jgi:protein-tyrosine phosphatase